MKRFRPKPGGRSRLSRMVWGAVFIVWGVLLVAYLIWLGWPHPAATASTLNNATTRKQIPITVEYRGTWQGKPIYVFHNNGVDLRGVNIYNWAEDSLPVLYIGDPNSFHPPTGQSLPSYLPAPYDVPSGKSIWVVSSSMPPAEFTVTWDSAEGVLFTTVHVAAKSTAETNVRSTDFRMPYAQKPGPAFGNAPGLM